MHQQTRDYIKISVETYLKRVCEKHMSGWMTMPRVQGKLTTPLPNRKEFIRGFLAAVGNEEPEAQRALEDEMGLGYRSGVGELIFAMVAARPDLAYAVTRLLQHSTCQHRLHFVGLKHCIRHACETREDRILYWRAQEIVRQHLW